MIPQVNATLTKVTGPAESEAYDGPDDGPTKWEGSAGAYYREARDRQRDAEGEQRVTRRELIVETDAPVLDWRSGDVVSFDVDGDPRTATVKTAERRKLAGISPGLQTTRLTFEG